uniref:Uncharacterized protein n=1 Tax=viral metagenome TaxID=1070528 RepID=A0A6M3LNA2_9ZZZZ
MTKRERIASYLIARGEKEVESANPKYRAFQREGSIVLTWVGHCGGIRTGQKFETSTQVWPAEIFSQDIVKELQRVGIQTRKRT